MNAPNEHSVPAGAEFYRTAIEAAIARSYDGGEGRSYAKHTIGDLCSAIFAVDNPEDARRFYDGYVAWMTAREDRVGDAPPEDICRSNIGWMFGEGMAPDRITMWVQATGSSHPIFGAMSSLPTAEEAFDAGKRLAAQP